METGAKRELQPLSESGDYYNVAFDMYNIGTRRIERICEWVDENVPSLAESIGVNLPDDGAFRVLSVGTGDGICDSKILSHLRDRTHLKIRAVIVEPDSHMMKQYQDLISKESPKLQGVAFDWRQQTFQEYQANAKEDDKFHFICSLNSIYYLGDVEKSVKSLYDKLENGGLLLITLAGGWGGLGKLLSHLQTLGIKDGSLTSFDVERACKKHNIPVPEIQTIKLRCDISLCFDPPDQLSKDGNTLLDFLTHTVNFAQNAPPEYREDVLRLMKSEPCSERGSAGEVIFDASNAAVIIRRQ